MNNHDEDRSVYNGGVEEMDIAIDRPVAQVREQYLDFGSWVTNHTIEEISSARRTLGRDHAH